ncbi:MAG: nuclear transport factor 2 family protein [Candidatus Thiodiazotropha sp.]
MLDLIAKTKSYAAVVNDRNVADATEMFAEDIKCSDPLVSDLTPKSAVVDFYRQQFELPIERFEFIPRNVIQQGNTTVMEFDMVVENKTLKGVDVIEWKDGLIVNLRAYLNGEVPAE